MPRSREVEQVKEWGAQGGKARAAKLTPEQRSKSARRAVQARWAKALEPNCSFQFDNSVSLASESDFLTSGDIGEYIVLSIGGESCSVNSRSFVITPNKRESFTQ